MANKKGFDNYQTLFLFRLLSVGVAGFEPATSSSQTRRDNRATLHPENDCSFYGRQIYTLFLKISLSYCFFYSIHWIVKFYICIIKTYKHWF